MIDVLSKLEVSPKCVSCTEGSEKKSTAEYYCRDCQDYLCQHCGGSHLKTAIFKGHDLIHTTGKRCLRKQCQVHPMKFKDYYCEPCQVLVCSACVTLKHRQHEVFDFQERHRECLRKTKVNLVKLTKGFPDPISDGLLEKKGLGQIIADVEEKTMTITEQIKITAVSLTEDIKKQAVQLTELVTTHHNVLLGKLKRAEKIPEVTPLRERCKKLLESSNPLVILREFKDISREIDTVVPTDMKKESPRLSVHSDFIYNEFKPELDISIGSLDRIEMKDFITKS